eukprot:GSChrysophyteH2.ASY1.ANO1.1142.1 assembled CDS
MNDSFIAGAVLFTGYVSWVIRLHRQHRRKTQRFSIIVHGGAFAIPDSIVEASDVGCQNAVTAGYRVLARGGSAVDAVEAAVRVLENDPTFDAGYGSVLTADQGIEMDAIIMDGKDLKVGAVAACTSVRNPISLAKRIKDETSHTLIVGAGADKIARKFGIEEVGVKDLVTKAAQDEWKQFAASSESGDAAYGNTLGHDTVGCVCIDTEGNVAAGTSTGGITFKIAGRVGDSCCIGAGCYADNEKGAVSTTGHGESIAKVCLAKSCADRLNTGFGFMSTSRSPQRECQDEIDSMRLKTAGGCGGVIAVTPAGALSHAFSTPRMCWASIEAEYALQADGTEKKGLILKSRSGVERGDNKEFIVKA